jgi:TonB family protein
MIKRSDRFLIWALAISFGLHAVILLSFRHMTVVEARPEPTPSHITIETRIPLPTPKPPVETPAPAHPASSSSHVHANAPHVTGGKDPGSEGPVEPIATDGPVTGIDPTGTSAPSVEPTDPPRPECSTPYAPASVIDAVSPSTPEGADEQTGTAQVKVELSATGSVVGVTIYRSAGNLFLDQAALQAARMSTYHSETKDCAAVGGSYLFTVDFTQ